MKRAIVCTALVLVALLVPVGDATAACHAFVVEAEPASAPEGATVKVTVSRDAAVGPSNIDVSTVDESATGGTDYTPLKQTVSFTNDTSQTFDVPLADDGAAEGSETFLLHLENPGGCTVNPNFDVGPDVRVTITDNDAAATTAPPSPTTTTADDGPTTTESSTTTTGSGDSTTTSSASTETTVESTSTTATEVAVEEIADDDDDDDGGGAGMVVAAVIAALVLAGAGFGAWRFRRR